MFLRKDASSDTIIYQIKSGDSLVAIIKKYYGKVSQQQQKTILDKILRDNPEIKNPNMIYPGQVLAMDIPQNYCPVPGYPTSPAIQADDVLAKLLKQTLEKKAPQERDLLSAMAPIMLGTGSGGLMMVEQTFKTNAPLVAEMAENYNDYKADKLTKGQYDYRRKTLLSKLKAKLGPINYLLNGTRSPNEVIRISRKKGSVPTQIMTQQVNRMSTLSKVASRGSVVLSVVGLGVACHQIASTDDKQQKNEILVESLGGVTGGILYGVGATAVILLMATPVGWVGALAIGVGGVVAGYTGSAIAKNVYDVHGNKFDLASKTSVSQLCKK